MNLSRTLAGLLFAVAGVGSAACVYTVKDFSTAEPCDKVGSKDWCIVRGNTGIRSCVEDEGVQYWTECVQVVGAQGSGGSSPGTTSSTNSSSHSSSYSAASTPLVLAFGAEAVAYTRAPGATFDLTGRQQSYAFDWPTASTPWLAIDRDGDGRIDGGAELFGSATRLASGRLAVNGFEALADADDNHDGRIDARDAIWTRLTIWTDANADRTSQADELAPAALRLEAINLGYRVTPRCDGRGNCERERGSFVYRDAAGLARTGAIVDIHLALR